MPEDKSFIESPWMQLGVPLAATVASAIAPRHAGRVSELALQGWNGINRTHLGQQRLSQLQAQEDADAAEDEKWSQEISKLSAKTPDAAQPPPQAGLPPIPGSENWESDAPEGGDTPAIQMAAKADALENFGQVASPNFQLNDLQTQALQMSGRKAGRPMLAKMLSEAGQPQKKNYKSDIVTNEYGDQVMNRFDEDSGNMTQFYVSGPKPEKPQEINTPAEGWMTGDPEKQRMAREWQQLSGAGNDMIVTGNDGESYWANPKTHAISPMRLSGRVPQQGAPQAAPPAQQTPTQVGQSAPVPPSGQTPQTGGRAPKGAPTSFSKQSSGLALTPNEIEDVAEAIATGQQPPITSGFGRAGAGKVRAALARKGYNLSIATLDYEATKRHLATINGPQQVRMRQAVNNASHQIDVIEGLTKEWAAVAPQAGFKVLNSATLAAAKAMPGQVGAVAHAMESQMNDLVSELANVYMGGNSPTDHSMKLAAANLSANWNEETFAKVFPLLRKNLSIRENSMNSVGVVGASPNSQYGHQSKEVLGQPVDQGDGGVVLSKSGRPMRKNAQGQYVYAD